MTLLTTLDILCRILSDDVIFLSVTDVIILITEDDVILSITEDDVINYIHILYLYTHFHTIVSEPPIITL